MADSDMMRVLGRIEGKLDSLDKRLSDHIRQDDTRFEAHEREIQTLEARTNATERRQSWFMGGLAAIGVVAAGVVTWLKTSV